MLAEIPEIHALASHICALGGALWVAEADGVIVGMVAVSPDEDGWHLSRMYVAAAHRGTGLAVALLRRAEEYARAAGADRMVLWSDVLFTRAHAFYAKRGYRQLGGPRALEGFPDVVEVEFVKALVELE